MESAAPSLDYAPPPRWHQRRTFRRALRIGVIVFLLLSLLVWAPFLYYWLAYRLPIKLAERRARHYTPATTQHVVYDDDPQTYPALLASGGYASSFTTIS